MDNPKLHQIKLNSLTWSIFLVLISELLLLKTLNVFLLPILATLIVRIIQIIFLLFIFKPNKNNLIQGVKTGFLWSILFGITALTIYYAFILIDINLQRHLVITFPKNNFEILLFFITAGLIAPIAEEIFFRGLIYTYFRKYSFIFAVILSTTFFALPHFQLNIFPIIPIIGGIVFALSFEYSKSLAAPIIIHVSGNLAIFTVSFLN